MYDLCHGNMDIVKLITFLFLIEIPKLNSYRTGWLFYETFANSQWMTTSYVSWLLRRRTCNHRLFKEIHRKQELQ